MTSLTIYLQHLHDSIRNANQELPDEEIHKLWKAIGSQHLLTQPMGNL